MLSQAHRLKKEKDFIAVLKDRRRAEGRGIFLKSIKNGLEDSRFGIIISKKISKKAVERNRIHRQISEDIWNLLEEIKTGRDVVIITTAEITKMSFEEIRESLKEVFLKAGLLN